MKKDTVKNKANAACYLFIYLSPANRAALDSIYRLSKDCLIDPSSWRSFSNMTQLYQHPPRLLQQEPPGNLSVFVFVFSFSLWSYNHSMCSPYSAPNPQIELPAGHRTKSERLKSRKVRSVRSANVASLLLTLTLIPTPDVVVGKPTGSYHSSHYQKNCCVGASSSSQSHEWWFRHSAVTLWVGTWVLTRRNAM